MSCFVSSLGEVQRCYQRRVLALPSQEKQQVTSLLLECGASIDEINAIRKHLSQLKGGQLARLVLPATLITLVLSDVVGDRLDVIASGPNSAGPDHVSGLPGDHPAL